MGNFFQKIVEIPRRKRFFFLGVLALVVTGINLSVHPFPYNLIADSANSAYGFTGVIWDLVISVFDYWSALLVWFLFFLVAFWENTIIRRVTQISIVLCSFAFVSYLRGRFGGPGDFIIVGFTSIPALFFVVTFFPAGILLGLLDELYTRYRSKRR